MSDVQPERDSEIRRRAAWLLAMLALVAALFVGLMVTFFNGSGGGGDGDVADLAGPTDSVSSTANRSPSPGRASTARGTDASSSPTRSTGASSTAAGSGRGSCPTSEVCALDTDIGDALQAINAYRAENGKSAVTGSVSAQAKKCALSNGSDCSGSWAETPVAATKGKVDGTAAVAKIQEFGKLLSDMKAVEIGWAFDPGSKQYFFAIVRVV